jgi:hypothetical protein
MFLIITILYLYQNHPKGCCSCLHQHTVSVIVQHPFVFELHETSMGHSHLICTKFILHTLQKVGSYKFPYPSNRSLLILSLSLFLTMVLSVEETLMNFGYLYVPNLIHQGAFVITKISFANGYRNLSSSNNYEFTHGPKLPKFFFQKVQNYTTSYKIKMRYDYTGCAHTCTI